MNVNRRRFVGQCAALAAAPNAALGSSQAKSAESEGRKTMHRCLFLDDAHIDRARGLTLRAHAGKKYLGNPLFQHKYPWEGARVQLYGHCIVYSTERKLYQMYYLAQPNTTHWPNVRVG